jgi:hypothetical protein
MKQKKKPIRPDGRQRAPGAGRKKVEDRRVALTFSIRQSKKEQAREIILPIVERINAE